jgi:monovalent cation:H+ antiporter-2, CPA2 family
MPQYSILEGILVLLASAVLVSTLFKRIKLPAVLGYLLVGITVGPYGLGLIPDKEYIYNLADFGVVFLMFTIGLEFSLPKLLSMKRMVLGLGGLQVILTTALTMAIAFIAGAHLANALVVGGVVAMSSTALVSKQLKDQLELTAPQGMNAIGILLFQDLAVIPFLILIPSLAHGDAHILHQLGFALLKAAGVMLVIIVAGRKLLRPLFHIIATTRSLELFTMAVLLITLMAAWITEEIGLSLALGAFLAGMMLGETEFRHQIEIEIRPFRDVLLALFFISVGMLFNVFSIPYMWRGLLILLTTMIVFKFLLIAFLTRMFGASNTTALRTGLILAQGGEFGFALLTLAMDSNLLSYHYNQLVLGALVLSMAISPFIIRYNKQISKFLEPKGIQQNEQEITQNVSHTAEGLEQHIIILGFGRVGQNIAKFLTIEGFQYVALDMDPVRVQQAQLAGERVAYGDSSNIQLLKATNLHKAKALIISFNDTITALSIIEQVRREYHDLPILVRTRDDSELKKLKKAGATEVIPEALEASLMLAFHILVMMGVPVFRAMRHVREMRNNRYSLLNQIFPSQEGEEWDELIGEDKEQLYVVKISPKSYAVGKQLKEIDFSEVPNIVITAIKRNNIRVPEPGPDTEIKQDDAIVLYGVPEDLEKAASILLQG